MKIVFILSFVLHVLASTAHAAPAMQGDRIEYIGHASFRFVANDGSSVVIDPYNSYIWLGYHYPKNIQADAVLVTHPHFDHDASYYFDNVPVFREPGTHKIGAIKVEGIATEHGFAEVIRKRGFLPNNTVWIIELGGKRILHLGDSRKVNAEELAKIGRVDIVIGDEEQASAASLSASHTIPNHYRLPQISATAGQGMPTVEEILKGKLSVLRLDSNVLMLSELQKQDKWIVLQPSINIEVWSDNLLEAKREVQLARQLMGDDKNNYASAEKHLTKALSLETKDISTYSVLADLYEAQGKPTTKVIKALEQGLAKSTYSDIGKEFKLRSRLGKLYEASAQLSLAKKHFEWVLEHSKAYGVTEYEYAAKFIKNAQNISESNN